MKLLAMVALAATTTLAAPVRPPPPMRTAHHPIGLQEKEALKEKIHDNPVRRFDHDYEITPWLLKACLEGIENISEGDCNLLLPPSIVLVEERNDDYDELHDFDELVESPEEPNVDEPGDAEPTLVSRLSKRGEEDDEPRDFDEPAQSPEQPDMDEPEPEPSSTSKGWFSKRTDCSERPTKLDLILALPMFIKMGKCYKVWAEEENGHQEKRSSSLGTWWSGKWIVPYQHHHKNETDVDEEETLVVAGGDGGPEKRDFGNHIIPYHHEKHNETDVEGPSRVGTFPVGEPPIHERERV